MYVPPSIIYMMEIDPTVGAPIAVAVIAAVAASVASSIVSVAVDTLIG